MRLAQAVPCAPALRAVRSSEEWLGFEVLSSHVLCRSRVGLWSMFTGAMASWSILNPTSP